MAYRCKKCSYEVFDFGDLQEHIHQSHDKQKSISTVKNIWARKV